MVSMYEKNFGEFAFTVDELEVLPCKKKRWNFLMLGHSDQISASTLKYVKTLNTNAKPKSGILWEFYMCVKQYVLLIFSLKKVWNALK